MNSSSKISNRHIEAPIRFSPGVERAVVDEAATITGLIATMRYIAEKTFADGGHAIRPVHAKSHGILEGYLEVDAGLPSELAQGLFAKPGRYPLVMRFSTISGDILDDSVSVPRGLAIKVISVEGERLDGSEGDVTQDFLLINGPAFGAPSPKAFLSVVRLLARTTDRVQRLKKLLSAIMRPLQRIIVAITGRANVTVATLGGASRNSHSGRNLLQSGRAAFWRLHCENNGGANIRGADGSQASAFEREPSAKWPPRGGGCVFQDKWR